MSYEGSCHCGAVSFTVAADPPSEAMSCNCSHCRRKGFLLSFVPAEAFTLSADEGALADYLFHKHRIAHRFCRTCGCQAHGEGKAPDGTATVAVNLRCVPGLDLGALSIRQVDGASF